MELTEQERMAINAFIGENWSQFRQVAEQFLSEEEVEELGNRLAA